MGNRLSKITTKTGDDGTSGLSNGERLDKDDLRFEAMGDVDELNSAIGLVLCACPDQKISEKLLWIQQQLFNLGGEISLPQALLIEPKAVEQLDLWVLECNQSLPSLKEFILPNGNRCSVYCHLARTICRRAERHLVKLHKRDRLNPDLLKFINRLSDLLFVFCRLLTKDDEKKEVLWDRVRTKA